MRYYSTQYLAPGSYSKNICGKKEGKKGEKQASKQASQPVWLHRKTKVVVSVLFSYKFPQISKGKPEFKFIEVLLLTVWTLKDLNVGCLIFGNIWLAGCDWYFALSQMYFMHPAPKSTLDLMWTCAGRNFTMLAGRWELKSAESYGIF